jgi:hypothetical protein
MHFHECGVGVLTWLHFLKFVFIWSVPPPRHHNRLVELKELRHTSTIEDYQHQFLTFMCHYDDMMPMQQVQMFTARLGEPLHTNVELAMPLTYRPP